VSKPKIREVIGSSSAMEKRRVLGEHRRREVPSPQCREVYEHPDRRPMSKAPMLRTRLQLGRDRGSAVEQTDWHDQGNTGSCKRSSAVSTPR